MRLRNEPSLALVLLVSALLLVGCAAEEAQGPVSPGKPTLRIETTGGPVVLEVEVADDAEERATGLMGRTEVPDGEGMVFLFDGPSTASFWMKDTPVPLSIAFWGAQGRIVAILDMAPCTADPCTTYAPGIPYVGAVEVRRGFFVENGVATGDEVVLEGFAG